MITTLIALSTIGKIVHPVTTHRVLIDVNVFVNAKPLFRYVENLRKAFAPDPVEIEVVFNDAGVLAIGKSMDDYLKGYERVVKFVACEQSLKDNRIDPKELNKIIAIVPSGKVELVRKQEDHWSYLMGPQVSNVSTGYGR